MRLATFEVNGRESWGIVVAHPAYGEDWIFEPSVVEERLKMYASQTSSYHYQTPTFLKSGEWPHDMVSFLELEDEGISALKRLLDFLINFLAVLDQAIMINAGFPSFQWPKDRSGARIPRKNRRANDRSGVEEFLSGNSPRTPRRPSKWMYRRRCIKMVLPRCPCLWSLGGTPHTS